MSTMPRTVRIYMLGFLSHLSTCSLEVKKATYFALVRPLLEYEACSWDPHIAINPEGFKLTLERSVVSASDVQIISDTATSFHV